MANIGIDLGTTHSLVSVVLSGKARVLLDDNENPLFPSVLQYDKDGNLTAIGTDALDADRYRRCTNISLDQAIYGAVT